jgi:hypothetical protein
VPDLESDDEDQENINGAPNSGVQDDGSIDMHNINNMVFSDEVIRINKHCQTDRADCAFTQHSAWTNQTYCTTIGVVGCGR